MSERSPGEVVVRSVRIEIEAEIGGADGRGPKHCQEYVRVGDAEGLAFLTGKRAYFERELKRGEAKYCQEHERLSRLVERLRDVETGLEVGEDLDEARESLERAARFVARCRVLLAALDYARATKSG